MPKYTEAEAREAVASSLCYPDVVRKLGLRPAGGNHALLRRYVDKVWKIPPDHFDADAVRARKLRNSQRVISPEEILVEGSSYSRTALKRRLYAAGVKSPVCELCGQDEMWQGRRMSLILDHVNGVPDDHRLENLRIVCPNCNATLDTHCARNSVRMPVRRRCALCDTVFVIRSRRQRFCSRECGQRRPKSELRRAERPPYERLLAEIAETSYSAVGRRHGVSDNAIRKWVRQYERERARSEPHTRLTDPR